MPKKKRAPWGLLAQFETPRDIFRACEKVRDEGFTRWDTHTPFPVHGLEKAMGLSRSKLPFVVAVLGFTGAGLGMLLQWWTSVVDYPLVVGGKPYFSWPAFLPVTFELGVLFGSAGAVLGLLAFCRLPRLHHSLFHSKRFEQFSDDKFFISVEAKDPKFDRQATAAFLEELGATHVEVVKK